MQRKIMMIIFAALLTVLSAGISRAGDEVLWTVVTTPDALIVLDLSGSMQEPPHQGSMLYVGGDDCSIDGPYYTASGTGHTKRCLPGNNSNEPNLYVSGTNCNIDGPFYIVSEPGHTRQCHYGNVSGTTPHASHYGTAVPRWSTSECADPFYRTSGTGHTVSCPINNSYGNDPPTYSATPGSTATPACTEPFYKVNTVAGFAARCQKVDVAKYALFNLLNNSNTDGLNQINSADEASLGIRLGLMRFYNVSKDGSDTLNYTYHDATSKIKLSWGITKADNATQTPYANIFCNNSTCSTPNALGTNTCNTCTTTTTSCTEDAECIVGYPTGNYTPLRYALREAKHYLDDHKLVDASASCRQKAVIFVTDGADTVSCSANGGTGISQRRAPVHQAKILAAAGYKVYVVGFGATMTEDLKRTLNWMAYYGGTTNGATQTGDTTALTVGANPCSDGTDPALFPLNGYAFMASNPADLATAIKTAFESIVSANYSFSAAAAVATARVASENYLYEASFEPKNNTGLTKEPFWTGHLKRYTLNTAGELMTNPLDAGAVLAATDASARNMWTYKSGSSLTAFTTALTAADFAVASTTRRDEVVGFYRGEATYNLENWKLGDCFHTNPIVVNTPSMFFYDPRECPNSTTPTSYENFRTFHPRAAADSTQIILAGANDGQLHAFLTGTMAEKWSFIPPNLLQKLSPIAHNSHADRTSLSSHVLLVDGPIQVANAWLPSSAGTGTNKSCTSSTSCDWKTIAVIGEGEGSGPSYLWSSSSTCYSPYNTSTGESGFRSAYSSSYPYYCGYHALDVTNTSATSPTYLWHLMPTAAQAPYLGEAWSKMQIGRVKIGGNEKWVGFIGGGYDNSILPAGSSAGKGFFVVDLTNGNILWSFTHGTASSTSSPDMDFSAPASPLPLDVDGDGFIDTVYMGDLGGNMWRFRFCPKDACSSCGLSSYTSSSCTASGTVCGTAQWKGSRLYSTTSAERGASNLQKQIFTKATATTDKVGNLWVYFGTGENQDPTWKPPTSPAIPDTNDTKNRLYGIKEDLDGYLNGDNGTDGDPRFTHTYTTTNLKDITTSTYCTAVGTGCTAADVTADATKHGWYIRLSTNSVTAPAPTGTIDSPTGEKMISDPVVFGGVVFFATYVPNQGTASACGLAGDAFLYGLNYVSGAGALGSSSSPTRTDWIGLGIGSSILVSYRPDRTAVDIYATASGGAGSAALTQTLDDGDGNPERRATSSMSNIIYWRDRRLQ